MLKSRTCKICGKEFLQDGSGVKKYCSQECWHKSTIQAQSRFRKRRKETFTTHCLICGNPTNSIKAKYCSLCRHNVKSQAMLGNKNPNFNKPNIMSKETREKLSLANQGKKSPAENTIGINNGVINKRVKPDELNEYLNQGWVKGWVPGTINNLPPGSYKTLKSANTVYEALLTTGNRIEKEVSFPDCVFKRPLKFDFAAYDKDTNKLKYLVEYDGSQHNKPSNWYHSNEEKYSVFIQTQIRDWLKDKYCIENNIPLIRYPSNSSKNKSFERISRDGYIVGVSQDYHKKLKAFDINMSDIVNYKKCSFTIQSGITCTFKCEQECGEKVCQNNSLINAKPGEYFIDKIIENFNNQNLAKAFVFQGLEPIDNLKQLLWFIYHLRKISSADVAIYTGYTEEECGPLISLIRMMSWENIIIKFGRFVPNDEPRFDEVLGVELKSKNQYAKKIS